MPKRGQPHYKPTEADRTTVLVMVAGGMRHDRIAPCLGTDGIDEKTLRKHFRRELDIGVDKINGLCTQGLVRLMQEGNLGALCFWAKTRMGWRETQKIEVSGQLSIIDAILGDDGKDT